MDTVRTALLGIAVSLTMVMNAGAITDFETTVAEIVQNPDKFNPRREAHTPSSPS